MSLSRDQILKHAVLPIGEVDVPEFGGKVRIAGLSVGVADDVRAITEGERTDVPFNLRVVVAFACDDKGQPLFTLDDVPALKRLPQKALNVVMQAALDLNGLSKQGEDDAKND